MPWSLPGLIALVTCLLILAKHGAMDFHCSEISRSEALANAVSRASRTFIFRVWDVGFLQSFGMALMATNHDLDVSANDLMRMLNVL